MIKKSWQYFRRFGLVPTIIKTLSKLWRVIRQVPLRIAEYFVACVYINSLSVKASCKTVYIMIPCIDWSIPLFQRPHQIAVELSKLPDAFVFFVPDQYQYDSFCYCKKINSNLYLLSTSVVKHLRKITAKSRERIVFMSWTRHFNLLKKFSYDKLIYEYIDELTLFYYYNKQMEDTHRKLMKISDVTVATATKLYENAKPFAKKLILCENAGDYRFFNNNRNQAVDLMLAEKLQDYDAVLGYYGCLAYWFDYSIVLDAAHKNPEWLFVLVGHVFDDTAKAALTDIPSNIIVIPAQPYERLPSFLNAFDIALVPFVINEITLSTSPVKIFEYMAAGKPILSADLPECRKYKSIYRYTGIEDFITKAIELLKRNECQQYRKNLDEEARQNTWGQRVKQMLSEVSADA